MKLNLLKHTTRVQIVPEFEQLKTVEMAVLKLISIMEVRLLEYNLFGIHK